MKFKFLLSIALITTLVACGGAEERKSVYMEKAKASIDVGDLDKARIELKNVLQIDPKDGDAYFLLGSVFEQQKNYRKAYANYLKAEELNPDLLENQAKLGRFYLVLLKDSDKAQEKVDFILSKEPGNADGLLLNAVIMYIADKKNEAVAIAKDIIAKNPKHTDSIIFLATLYMKEKKLTEAIKLLDTVSENYENNEALHKLLAVALLDNKEYKRAEVIYKIFLERNPGSRASYDNLAAFYIKAEDHVKAEETLRASVESNKDDVQRQLTLVNYIKVTKSNSAAIDELKNLIASQNGEGKLRLALIELYLITNDKKSAIEACNQAIADFPDEETGIGARLSLATIYIGEGSYDKANEIVEAAMLISPNDPEVNFIRAKLALNDKDTEKAIISLRIVTKEKPENIDAYLLLANLYQYEKNDAQAKNILNTAYDNNKTNAESLLKLAQYLSTRDIDQASKIIDSYNSLKESEYDGLSLKASLLNKNKEHLEAYKIAEQLMELFSDKPNGYLQATPYLAQQGDKEKAISVLEKGYLSTKDNRKLLILLTSLQVADKKFDVVEMRIKAQLKAAPDDTQLKVLLAKVYVLNGKINQAKSLLDDAVRISPEFEEPYLVLSQVHHSNNDADAVKAVLMKGWDNVDSSVKIPFRLASIYEVEGAYKDAIDVYTRMYQSHPENLIVINNLASTLSDYGDGEKDLEFAKKLANKLKESDQPVFLDTIGWVYYKGGDLQKAVQYLSQVVEKMPGVNVFNYHLGMAYKMSGNKAQAKIYLEKSLADKQDFNEKMAAEAALKSL